jgi:hypothetical protein
VLRDLSARGFEGPLCLDLRDIESATDGLHESTTLIRMARAALRSAKP